MLIGYAVTPAERRALAKAGVVNLYFERTRSPHRPERELAIKDCRDGDTLIVCGLDRLGRRNSTFNAIVRRLYRKGTRIENLGSVPTRKR